MKPMNLQYTRITNTSYKFFYEEDGLYGEFYLELNPDGSALIEAKDPDYAPVLTEAFKEAMC